MSRLGAVALAQVTGLPAVPVSFHLNLKIRLKSWNRFQIPLPFSRCEITIGQTLWVPRGISVGHRELLRQQLEAGMCAIARDK
ncbi:MAG: hypothetical protein ABSF60_07870 [Verrucomicrobiota bacterium]